eukprot:CAMPEP_0198338978 /NCGR_PEP_ID=MMETSP1450-20131203/37655_1 /TAXON_ID=753684 ORGANISM="Madagascaria erythrocladiodes, Strain CCMP3234" /NCGR_SAMPLE_ID=MMETSP1450 /ASSEMBLY_ACC=CAM_ASM_001115 /LENGTH=135 /DNA_ID=CAMNT_0044043877 /DNA_START=90 /DNA_END=497 /DNA_ORIENTATION=-
MTKRASDAGGASGDALENTLMYEVNLSVTADKRDEYVAWLQSFIDDVMLKIDGFESAEVFLVDADGDDGADAGMVSVHYRVRSDEYLRKYKADDALQKRITTAGADEFKYTVVSRRVLRSKQRHHAQSSAFGYVL